MTIPDTVASKLSDPIWLRSGQDAANEALLKLDIRDTHHFAEFYRKFWGPFHSRSVGYELLDLVEGGESVLSNTAIAREEFGFPDRFLVISSLCGNAVLVYDSQSGGVFDVDFEGSHDLLKAGNLEPRWPSWNAFLSDYFSD